MNARIAPPPQLPRVSVTKVTGKPAALGQLRNPRPPLKIAVVNRRWLAWARAEPEGPRTVLTGVVWYQEGEKPSAFGKVWVRLPWLDGPR